VATKTDSARDKYDQTLVVKQILGSSELFVSKASMPRFSPDSLHIGYALAEENGARSEVYLMDIRTGSTRKLYAAEKLWA
jgi:Tol biopolymer transport system component